MSDHLEGGFKVLHVAPEMAPFSKIGGLADVISSLPGALNRIGTDARVLIPAFPGVFEQAEKMDYRITRIRRNIDLSINWRVYSSRLWKIQYGTTPVYVLDNPDIFNDPGIYPGELNQTTALPFIFLSFAAFQISNAIPWTPDIFHLHDWSTSIVPIAMKWHPYFSCYQNQYRTVLTIHNLAHQGILKPEVLEGWGLNKAFHMEGLEYYNSVNLLKGAIIASHAVTTVSPRYASEITHKSMGMGLEGVVKQNISKVSGILNGLDTDYWNPSSDSFLPSNYDRGNMSGKMVCRSTLFEKTGWEKNCSPLITMVGRLYKQKGIELMLEGIEQIINWGGRIFILGSGEKTYEEALFKKTREYPDKVSFVKGYDEPLAHLVYGAGDIFLMPSLFEPCGLSQLISLRYGTVPVVRSVGGLADTVLDADSNSEGFGFVFSEFSSHAMLSSLQRAFKSFKNKNRWNSIRDRGMKMDFSWNHSAPEYQAVYSRIYNQKIEGK